MVKEFFVAACAILALAATPAKKDVEEEQEHEITLDEVPEAARSAILNEAGENPIREVDEIVIGEETYFEAEWIAEGDVIGREIEDSDDEEEDEDRAEAGRGDSQDSD
jgi:hypothetical protein